MLSCDAVRFFRPFNVLACGSNHVGTIAWKTTKQYFQVLVILGYIVVNVTSPLMKSVHFDDCLECYNQHFHLLKFVIDCLPKLSLFVCNIVTLTVQDLICLCTSLRRVLRRSQLVQFLEGALILG